MFNSRRWCVYLTSYLAFPGLVWPGLADFGASLSAFDCPTSRLLELGEWVIRDAPRGRFLRAVVILILIAGVLVAWNLPALSAFAG